MKVPQKIPKLSNHVTGFYTHKPYIHVSPVASHDGFVWK